MFVDTYLTLHPLPLPHILKFFVLLLENGSLLMTQIVNISKDDES